jgi:hypothetical protein
MLIDIVTKEDLEQFRLRLMEDIKAIMQPPPAESSKTWLKSYEVRKILCISNGTLQNLRIQKKIRYSKVGGLLFYKHEDIMKLLEAGVRNK